ncbi:hypothetical protein [Flavobacterium sp. GSP14]|uniref:hypothetical protein n=1 Tax=Flavobacterium sp. GSP14 TaxID=3401734 RepID=UPI003AAC3A7B
MEIQLNFGKLDPEKVEFLKAGVKRNSCKTCNKKADFKIIDGIVTVENVCCGSYAKIIGGALTTININKYAIEFRGKFLNTFCLLESFIDDIIDIYCLHFNVDIEEKVGRKKSEIGIREKKQLFKICLDNYQTSTNISIEKIWGNLNNIIETRNHLAHWMVDTSEESINLTANHKIRFVDRKERQVIAEDIFDAKKVAKYVMKIESLTTEMIEIYKFYTDYQK